MVSAAEQLAANLNFGALAKADELKKRIWFTLGALLVYRLGTYIPLPGIDPNAWEQIFNTQAGGILGMFNMFSGGGIHRMAIFALNIMPYISASIIIQLMTTVSPTLENLKKEGEQGRKVMNQYTRYLTVVLAAFQSYGIAIGLEGTGSVVSNPGIFFLVSTTITLTGGTMFLMWLGEQITSRGIGNGISLIIMAGIVAQIPSAIAGTLELGRQGALSTGLILVVMVMAIAVIAFIVFMERAQRRLLIQYPKRQVGNQMISASIIIQLMTTVSPTLENLKKEGEQGRKVMNQYTRYLTVVLAAFQSYGIAIGLEGTGSVVSNPGIFFLVSTTITLTGGTMFLMWLGEQITSRGIGNGISLIIMAGIVAQIPSAIAGTLELGRQGALSTGLILVVMVMAIAVIAFIVFMERAQRRLLIQYPKRQVGNQMFEGQTSHLPLKLNTSGVIPPIFASSLLLLPTTVANFNAGQGPGWLTTVTTLLGHGRPLFLILYIALIVFFAFFYTAIVFNPTETADNLKKHGGFIPGIRPGERTAEYIDYVLSRITVVGAIYLAIVCLVPEILISYAAVPFYFGGTSLLIVVSVTMDTVAQVQGYLLAHQYEGLIKRSRLRGRNR